MSRALILRADTQHLPLPDASVDLIMTSPPYWQLRTYEDDGEVYDGQLGQEDTWQEYLDSLIACTREWLRVLKPGGSFFLNLGDKYATSGEGSRQGEGGTITYNLGASRGDRPGAGYGHIREKSLVGLPWRYAVRCVDELGLVLRAEIIWSKANHLPESVQDRVVRSHEQLFHFTQQGHYYSARDDIREPCAASLLGTYARGGLVTANGGSHPSKARQTTDGTEADWRGNPLGKAPGSVWTIAAEPLRLPDYLKRLVGNHFAAFPTALVRPVVLGWSPPAVCTACGQGRFPVTDARRTIDGEPVDGLGHWKRGGVQQETSGIGNWRFGVDTRLLGYACACTPYTDHPRTGELYGGVSTPGGSRGLNTDKYAYRHPDAAERTGAWREYHLDGWNAPPGRPAVILDPLGGTGTVALVAAAHGRIGISADLSGNYGRIAQYRVRDGAERAVAAGQPRPPKKSRRNEYLYGDWVDRIDAAIAEGT